ncbi:Putative protein Kre1 [Septoria linicola]|uniref:Uncharacterized protein n=1 Tax=Septoria linicola TaxID=215465 RepID=A0A9Q9AI55_9PEZI|nr:putative protein Kre1 [Septoria linicola]USW49834.1 Putative protein Kre1 [Septoria linicola]
MRFSMASLCLSTLICATARGQLVVDELVEDDHKLEARAQVQPDATTAVTQAPAVTTLWMQSQIDSSVTYVEVVYTQTFASVVDQWPSPKSGEIGYGTLQKDKRDAEPTPIAGRFHARGG